MNLKGEQKWTTLGKEPCHYCEGCKMLHAIWVFEPCPGTNAIWTWNSNYECPTFAPSVSIRLGDTGKCHYFLREGKIEYLSDCTHHLAGKTVDVPPLPEWARD